MNVVNSGIRDVDIWVVLAGLHELSNAGVRVVLPKLEAADAPPLQNILRLEIALQTLILIEKEQFIEVWKTHGHGEFDVGVQFKQLFFWLENPLADSLLAE